MLPGCAFCPEPVQSCPDHAASAGLTCCALIRPAQIRQPLKLMMWAVQVGQRWDEFSTEEQAQLASISFSLLQQGQSCPTDWMQAALRPSCDDMHVVWSLQ